MFNKVQGYPNIARPGSTHQLALHISISPFVKFHLHWERHDTAERRPVESASLLQQRTLALCCIAQMIDHNIGFASCGLGLRAGVRSLLVADLTSQRQHHDPSGVPIEGNARSR